MAMVKRAEIANLIDRVNLYLRDNPTCNLLDAAAVLGIKVDRIRKWKERGKITHITNAQARREGITTKAEAKAVRRMRDTAKPVAKKAHKQSSGEVAPSSAVVTDEVDALIAKGREMKISNLRALIKSHLMLNVHDSKAVSNYAAGLKALSGVQDVELEDIYETEQLIKIYVPQEDAMTALEAIEVEKIEY